MILVAAMKPRHAAVLVLVGWYLTLSVNPMGGCLGCNMRQTGPAIIDVWGVYPDASVCQRVQKKLMARFAENQKHPKSEYLVLWSPRCDPSDDQMFKRLQPKFLSLSEKNAIVTTGAASYPSGSVRPN